MTAQSTLTNLPPQLRALSARAQDLTDTVRDALQATLSVSKHNATPEQVLAETFNRLGYLPEEAKHATRKVLT
jgi:Holliday junction resolvasome RuvABC DNA-binding subunit